MMTTIHLQLVLTLMLHGAIYLLSYTFVVCEGTTLLYRTLFYFTLTFKNRASHI
jgi:hypothetical protein